MCVWERLVGLGGDGGMWGGVQIFRKEPFFYGHDNYDQLVKIAKVRLWLSEWDDVVNGCVELVIVLWKCGCCIVVGVVCEEVDD